jgi:hypothetical protein
MQDRSHTTNFDLAQNSILNDEYENQRQPPRAFHGAEQLFLLKLNLGLEDASCPAVQWKMTEMLK